MDVTQEFAQWLADHGLRVTHERIAVLHEAMRAPGHFDIEYLMDQFRKQHRLVSRATAYRTLAHLVESGLVQKIQTGETQALYERMHGRQHHDHLICLGCGEIIEFTNDEIERLQDWVCNTRRFTIVSHTLQIKGYCEACTEKGTAEAGASQVALGKGAGREAHSKSAPQRAAKPS